MGIGLSRFFPTRARRAPARRAWRLVLAAAAATALAVLLLISISRRRADAVAPFADRAAAAVEAARRADAMTWAPDELLAAEASLRAGRLARREQDVRLWPLHDYASAAAAFAGAETGAGRAAALASSRRTAALAAADAELARAAQAVAEGDRLAGTIHLEASRRLLLTRARLALEEARVFRRSADFIEATAGARRAQALAALVRDHAAAVAARYADERVLAVWRQWKAETIAWSRRARRAAIVVSKEGHRLTLYVSGEAVRSYRADMGFNWVADKRAAGDGATPEGRYSIAARKSGSQTIYYRALLLDYPNADDRRAFARARRAGDVSPDDGIGGLIEIHGEGGRGRDWTRGCVALANPDIDDLFRRVQVGTPVTIIGSDEPGALAAMAVRHDAGDGRR